MKTHKNTLQLISAAAIILGAEMTARAGFTVFEASGAAAVDLTPTRDAFRTAVGGGTTAGANGGFGGERREINWDGVPGGLSDPAVLPPDFFNTTSPRGVVLSTPGSGFLVSANAGGATPELFGFASDFQTFSAQKLFTAVDSNITDVSFFQPGTPVPATTSAFGVFFTDAETGGSTVLEFFDLSNNLIFTRETLVTANQGLSFVGGIANAGERISRVRITSGLNTIAANGLLGNPNDDVVVMDDFIYAEPVPVPETGAVILIGLGLAGPGFRRRRVRAA